MKIFIPEFGVGAVSILISVFLSGWSSLFATIVGVIWNREYKAMTFLEEGLALWRAVQRAGGAVSMVTIPESSSQPGHLFDTMLEFFLYNDVIIGATNFSLITTRAVREVLLHGKRFLSLPLATNNRQSMLTFDFLQMDPSEAAEAASGMLRVLSQSQLTVWPTPLERWAPPALKSTSASRKPKPTGTLWWTPRSAISAFHPPPLP